MKIKLGAQAKLPFLDTAGVMPAGGGNEPFTVGVVDPTGTTVVAAAVMTAVVDVPQLYLSALILFSKPGTYVITYTHGDVPVVVKKDTVEVGTDPVTDFPRDIATNLILDQRIAGGDAETVQVHVIDQTAATHLVATVAPHAAASSGYVASHTFDKEGYYFLVWFKENVGGQQEPFYYDTALVLTPSGAELCHFVVATLEGNNGNPHAATTVIVSFEDGTSVGQKLTDMTGDVRFNLNPGKHVVSLIKDDVVFSTNNFKINVLNTREVSLDPALQGASGTEIQAFQLVSGSFSPTATTPISPAAMCELYADIYRMNGKPLAHATVQVGLVHRAQLFDGTAVFDTQTVYKTDGNGHVEFKLVQGIQVEIIIAPLSIRRIVIVPAGDDAIDPDTGEFIPINLLDLMSDADDVFDIIKAEIPAAPRRTL